MSSPEGIEIEQGNVVSDTSVEIHANQHLAETDPVEDPINAKPLPDILKISASPQSVVVILTQWKQNTLKQLLPAILRQTIRIDDIIVFQNEAHVNLTDVLRSYPRVKHMHNVNKNTKYFGRFLVPLYLNASFVAILDDNCIPSHNWLRHSIQLCQERNAIIGGTGRILAAPKRVVLDVRHPHPNDVEVDYAERAWVFRREWIHHFWRTPPFTQDTAADIHFSAAAQIHGNIPTVVPRSPRDNRSLWVFPSEDIASRKIKHADVAQDMRKGAIKYWQKMGWQLLFDRTEGSVMKLLETDLSSRSMAGHR
jgi:hypothetical protein